MQQFRIENELLIPIAPDEVSRDRAFLKKVAQEWAASCLDEKTSDEDMKIIGKETRDTLRKKRIEDYIAGNLSKEDMQDVFIGLLKSYYIYYEASKIMTEIKKRKAPIKFTLNGAEIEINLYSLVHIVNRHYGELISPQFIKSGKTFHNPKIEPGKINLFIDSFIKAIQAKGMEKQVVFRANNSILFRYYDNDYALFIKDYKYNKSILVIETFFIIDAENQNSRRLIDKIQNSHIIELNQNLYLYVEK